MVYKLTLSLTVLSPEVSWVIVLSGITLSSGILTSVSGNLLTSQDVYLQIWRPLSTDTQQVHELVYQKIYSPHTDGGEFEVNNCKYGNF